MRKVLTDIVNSDDNLEVVGVARDGEQAVELTKKLRPDCITLDVEMPKMNGLQALKAIMEQSPTPVIMLSSITFEGAQATIEALELGAVDFITKPGGSISLNIHDVKDEIIRKIYVVTRVNLKSFVAKPEYTLPTITRNTPINSNSSDFSWLVAIGTSTGGPKALNQVITKLPKDLPAAYLVVQHMPPGFTKSLADRLNNLSNLTVKEAEDGEEIKTGHVYIAPGDYHLQVNQGARLQIKLTKEPNVNGHRPSVDVLFNSVSQIKNLKLVAVIMTGMGHDGRDGIVNLKKSSSFNIGESSETCVVYGMPKAAMATGCIDIELPLYKIPFKLQELIKRN